MLRMFESPNSFTASSNSSKWLKTPLKAFRPARPERLQGRLQPLGRVRRGGEGVWALEHPEHGSEGGWLFRPAGSARAEERDEAGNRAEEPRGQRAVDRRRGGAAV